MEYFLKNCVNIKCNVSVNNYYMEPGGSHLNVPSPQYALLQWLLWAHNDNPRSRLKEGLVSRNYSMGGRSKHYTQRP